MARNPAAMNRYIINTFSEISMPEKAKEQTALDIKRLTKSDCHTAKNLPGLLFVVKPDLGPGCNYELGIMLQ
jgi:hypothetical protein